MKKKLYYLPIIILIIYMILFVFLQKELLIIKEGISIIRLENGLVLNVDGPANFTTFEHTTFQIVTFIVIIITLLIKIIMEILVLKERIEITKKEKKTNLIIYILLCSIIAIVTIYTTVIEPTAFLK